MDYELNIILCYLDQVAVPDFDIATAMENWGLVVYRDIYLLYNELTNSIVSKQEVATVIAHELTHQVSYNIFVFFVFCFHKKKLLFC